ncbi:MAG: hypothetical protein PVJ97_02985, partial [Flavobacteriaceae bacterium]
PKGTKRAGFQRGTHLPECRNRRVREIVIYETFYAIQNIWSFSGGRFTNGYSDHFPVYIYVIRKPIP